MIVSNTPLRISLFGGSTDNPYFVEKYGRGSVISFACDLKTYTSISQDKFGKNRRDHKYIINYSQHEESEVIDDIKNDIVRLVFEYFNIPPVLISMTSDIFSNGSGLASSSSYFISVIKAVSIFLNKPMTDTEICKLALELEQKMNPYCGYQDPYGCGVGGFKRMDFYKGGSVKYEFLPNDIFNKFDIHLIFTGVTRNSVHVLKNISENIDKSLPLLDTVDKANEAIINSDYKLFIDLFNESWSQKKNTSSVITESPIIKIMDENLDSNPTVLGHKLCGAGNGGFFLVFSKKNKLSVPYECVKISLSVNGVEGIKL